jgi:hypothetical protein
MTVLPRFDMAPRHPPRSRSNEAESTERRLGVKGGCRRQVDGTAGLFSTPEMPGAPRQLRLVPLAVVKRTRDVTETI